VPPRRERPSVRGNQRRAALLQALTELVEQRRYHEIEIGDITSRAGVGRSAFYFYFPSKAAAVAALLEDLKAQFVAAAAAWHQQRDATPRERVQLAIGGAVIVWRANAATIAAVFDAAATDQEVAAAWQQLLNELTRLVAARLRDERAVGIATHGPPTTTYSTILLDMNLHAAERDVRKLLDTGHGTKGLVQALTEIWVRALYAETE
jgi:TetR/AcrR family transcriptional regulator, ethionamide resistance regulator